MNCIFICLFNNPHYINMLYLLLESIYNYGLQNDNSYTEILIYTSTKFMNIIKQSPFFKDFIRFEINDTYGSVEKACKARLDLFDLLVVEKYSKILYLDTDIIVKGDLNSVFDVCQKDKLYALEEGSIADKSDFWGASLFPTTNKMDAFSTAFSTAFSSGILLFNNSKKMKTFFINVKQDMINRPFKFYCHDQPYIVYNAFKYDLYDNQALKQFVINNDHDINSSKIIHHFPGDPGMHRDKLKHMFAFFLGLKQNKTKH